MSTVAGIDIGDDDIPDNEATVPQTADIGILNNNNNNSLLEECTGTENLLVGISPTFWAHVPLFISQVHTLILLVDGVNCLILPNDSINDHGVMSVCNNDNNQDTTASTMTTPTLSHNRFIPVSKCKLVGTIVYAERKSNGGVMYIIDDGTGIIDCVHWDNENDDYDGLPSLTGNIVNEDNDDDNDLSTGLLSPGTVVRVMGRIHVVSVGTGSTTVYNNIPCPYGNTPMEDSSSTTTTKSYRIYETVVREIKAYIVDPIRSSSRATPNSIDAETHHWLDCIHMQQQQQQQQQQLLFNPLDVIQLLGPNIASQIELGLSFPSNDDDTCGLWQLFGPHCQCKDSIIKNELLYCHCIATPERLDPNFVYRDELLQTILGYDKTTIQSAQLHSKAPPPPTIGRDDDIHRDDNSNKDTMSRLILFQYKTVVADTKLQEIAIQQTMQSTGATEPQNHLIPQLIRKTFSALQEDGIFHFLDEKSDTYMLISKSDVLEPYIRRSWAYQTSSERTKFYSSRPKYLENVRRDRLHVIRRQLEQSVDRNSVA